MADQVVSNTIYQLLPQAWQQFAQSQIQRQHPSDSGVLHATTAQPQPKVGGIPTPQTLAAKIDPELGREYTALAAELGIDPGPITKERFKAFLAENGIPCYIYKEVAAYLEKQYGKAGPASPTWGWRPVREIDRQGVAQWHYKNGMLQRAASVYKKAIPMPVLYTMKKIKDAFPDAHFFISDEMNDVPKPDPFLLVAVSDYAFVVERWDEPGFVGKTE